MPPDTGAIDGKAPAEASPAPAARFEVPEFLVPKSLAEVRELARLLALAEWAPDSYRDPEGNYVPQKIELAIMHGITVGLGPIAAMQSIAVIDGMPTIGATAPCRSSSARGSWKTCWKSIRSTPRRG